VNDESIIVRAGIVDLADLFRRRDCTPTDALRCILERIDRHNPQLRAFVDLDRDGALAAAEGSTRRWAQGAPLSALDGVPIGIKANIAVRGLPWTAGIGALRERVATDDAPCVARLRRAGAVIVGTSNMDEGALGARCDNPWFGRTRNPRAPDRTPGGSSGGAAAAVAAGLCAGALGTDTMGSVRLPAACCGVVGHAPEPGRIDRAGATPLAPTFDRVGVLARSVADAALLLDVAAVQASTEPAAGDPAARHRLAALVVADDWELDPDLVFAYEQSIVAARVAGCEVTPLRLDDFDIRTLLRQMLLVVEAEGHAAHEALLIANLEGFSPSFRSMLAWGGRQSAGQLATARQALSEARDAVRTQISPYAALLSPAMPRPPETFYEPTPWNRAAFTVIASIAGLPGTSLPGAPSHDGLPAGLHITARSDTIALHLAGRIEATLSGAPPPDRPLT
jgi:aspartyl-tRNA(Asn)/glutamyl-tRNA(Gln) amidotransferase subunit A